MFSHCVSIVANPSTVVWRLRRPVVMGGSKSGGSDEVDASPPSRGNVVWCSQWKTTLIMMNVFLLLVLLILAPMILKLWVEFERLETELDERIESMEKTLISWDRLEGDEVREIIKKEIAKHAADGIGRVDYAVASCGGRVLKHSKPSVLSSRLSRWISGNVHRDAVKMLQPSFGQTGECFPLKGDNGFVEVKLCTSVVPEAITVEHVSKSVALDRSNAPKACKVLGWLGDEERKEKMHLLTKFRYNLKKSNVQTFNVVDPTVVDTIRLEFTSNHGNPNFTCIYRVRVHGHEPNVA